MHLYSNINVTSPQCPVMESGWTVCSMNQDWLPQSVTFVFLYPVTPQSKTISFLYNHPSHCLGSCLLLDIVYCSV